jgi:hypothetical protein
MRRTTLLLAPVLLAAPLTAQGFEGTIAMRLSGGQMGAMDITMHSKGDRSAMVMKMPASAGPMAGSEVRTVINNATHKMTMLLPAMPGMPLPAGSKGMKMTMDMSDIPGAAGAENTDKVAVRKLGTSQTIAGYACDDYEVTADKQVMSMCVTDRLGKFTMPGTGMMGRQQAPPAWARAFGDKPMFPLKVWGNADGTAVQMEVLSVKAGSVPASVLDDSAEGYVDMSAMMGGMRRNN